MVSEVEVPEPVATGVPQRVRVRTEVAAVAKLFDYAVPSGWRHDLRVGTRVRVPLHGRSVRGWIVDTEAPAPTTVDLLPLKSWLGWGPPECVVALAEWAAWRWAGPSSFFLRVASPGTVVRTVAAPPSYPVPAPGVGPDGRAPGASLDLASPGPALVRQPPVADPLDLVLAVLGDPVVRARAGSVVVLVPSSGWAERLAARLVHRGWPVARSWSDARAGWPVVVGSRADAWAPVPQLAAAVVLDAHDAAYREESAPTYSAVDVLVERARRDHAPCVLASPVPSVDLAAIPGLRPFAPTLHQERAGWPALERVDRRGADPRSGLFSEEFVRLARSVLSESSASNESRVPNESSESERARGPLVCVYNRTGGARLLACNRCGELARCVRCGAATHRDRNEHVLRCPRCGETRPVVCTACGGLRLKTLRVGVSRLREELSALLGVEVAEISGPRSGDPEPQAPALVGTEAVLHRVRRAAAVAFLDVDLHLLAPRLSATDATLALLVRAGRLVGARGGPPWARLQVQTRVPDHPVLEAVARGEPEPVLAAESAVRRDSALPPYVALALVSGARAGAYADALAAAAGTPAARGADSAEGITVAELDGGRFLVQAPSHRELCDLLARTPRPAGRGLRVEVDPAAL